MTPAPTSVIATAAAVLTAVVLAVMAGLLLGRLRERRRAARRARATHKLRPRILSFLTDEEAPLPPVDGADPTERAVLTEQLLAYGRLVRGEPRERIAAWLSDSGDLDRARRLLCTGHSGERRGAALLLGATGQDADVEPLWRAMTQDRDLQVRVAALQALATLGTPGATARFADLPEVLPLPDMLVAEALRKLTARDPAPLAAACTAGEPSRRRLCCLAAGVLGTTDDGRMRTALRLAAADGEPPLVRAAALQSLGAIGGAAEVDTLRGGLQATDQAVRAGALRGAAAMRSPLLLGELAEILFTDTSNLLNAARAYVACGGLRRDNAELVEATEPELRAPSGVDTRGTLRPAGEPAGAGAHHG